MIGKRNEIGRQARILVVDDEQMIALGLSEILAEEGYQVAAVFSGERAVEKAAEFLPDLLISDVSMGAMNGVVAATAITAMLPDCRVLFLSGHSSISDVVKTAPERLTFSFIPKPADPLDLLNAVAYMAPAFSAAHSQASLALDLNPHSNSVIGMGPAEADLLLTEVGA